MIITGDTKAIASAYITARSEINTRIAKTEKGAFGKFATLNSVLDAITAILAAHKIVVLQEPLTTETGIAVATSLLHESGATIEFGALTMPLADRKPQAVGSAVTYARRYALVSIFGLMAVDDDGQAAQDTFEAKPKVVANGTSHHDDTLWDTPAAHAKKPDNASPAQVKRCNSLGVKFYGTELWATKLPSIVAGASKGSASTLEALKDVEIDRVIAGLDKLIAERAAQLQAASN